MTITVKEAVKMAAQILGIGEGVNAAIEGESTAVGERDRDLLLTAFYTVENELALDYFPLLATASVTTETGEIAYSTLRATAVRILSVTDESGKEAAFEIFPEYVKTKAGSVTVKYAYAPTEKGIDEESEYKTAVSKRLFAYGMAAEYSFAVGELTEASVWDKKYKDALQSLQSEEIASGGRIPERRWA